MKEIKIPKEFLQLCTHWHQDMSLIASKPEQIADELIRGLSDRDKAAIKRFLDKLLSGGYSTAEIKGVWRRSLRDVFGFGRAKDAYRFTVLLRDKLD